MSHLFKLMKENVSDVPLETSKESIAINEELEKIKKEETFYNKLLASLSQVSKCTQSQTEAQLAMWELLRGKGTEWKEVDFNHGSAVCKTVQACNVVEVQRQKTIDQSIASMEQRLAGWSHDQVKAARTWSDSYTKLHRSYSNAAHKVQQINRDKKVQLSDLAAAEKKRDDLLAEWEREGRVGLQNLEHIFDKAKSTLMVALSEYVSSQITAYENAIRTLARIQSHLGDLIQFSHSQEALHQSSLRELQNTLQSEEERQRAIDNAPRNLHTSLLSESEAMVIYSSRCPLNSSWEVKRDGRSSGKTTVGFDIRSSALTIGETTWHVGDVLTLTKTHKSDSAKIKISFVDRETKDEQLTFFSIKDREAFYESFCLLRRGLGNSFVAATQHPVTHEEVKIWTGSFNMGDAPPEYNNEVAWNNWMPRNKYDFYVVAFQESEYTPRSGYLTAEDDLFTVVRVHLGDNYMKLAGVSLQHIRLVCFVCRDHYHKITGVKTATVATGLAGVIGNKGCAAISFMFYDARFCFVGSHLAARIDKKRLEARNQNYRDILKGLASGFSQNGLSDIHHEFDYLFWLGDLNYRIDTISRDEIIAKANAGNISALIKHDQLLNERALGNCFLDFEEPPILFGPTYRFNRGDRTWSEEKMREPAYCDRVLYKTVPSDCVRSVEYGACHDLMTSDHSPIYATFAVAVYLPAMPHIRDPMCKVSVRDISASDVRFSGNSNNPAKYALILQAPWISSSVTTITSCDTIDSSPRWTNEIPLYPITTSRTYLNSRWIRAVVRDSKGDIGVGIIYLRDALSSKNPNQEVRWSITLVDKGRPTGKLTGTLQVTFNPSYVEPWQFNPGHGVLPSYYDTYSILSSRNTRASTMGNRSSIADGVVIKSKQSQHVRLDGNDDSMETIAISHVDIAQSPVSTNENTSNQALSSSLSQTPNATSSSTPVNNPTVSGPGSAKHSWASRSPTVRGTPPMPINLANSVPLSSSNNLISPPSNTPPKMGSVRTNHGSVSPTNTSLSIGITPTTSTTATTSPPTYTVGSSPALTSTTTGVSSPSLSTYFGSLNTTSITTEQTSPPSVNLTMSANMSNPIDLPTLNSKPNRYSSAFDAALATTHISPAVGNINSPGSIPINSSTSSLGSSTSSLTSSTPPTSSTWVSFKTSTMTQPTPTPTTSSTYEQDMDLLLGKQTLSSDLDKDLEEFQKLLENRN